MVSPDSEEMTYIRKLSIEYAAVSRIVNIVWYDLSRQTITVSTDQPKLIDPDDDDKMEVRPEERLPGILINAFKKSGIDFSDDEIAEIQSHKKINRETLRNVVARENADTLLIPMKIEFKLEAGDLSEVAIDKFDKLTPPRLKPVVKSYHSDHSTFEGFLAANPDFDAFNNGKVIKAVLNMENIQTIGRGFIIFLFNADNELESARIVCNISTGSVRVMVEKGSNIHERVYQELDSIFS